MVNPRFSRRRIPAGRGHRRSPAACLLLGAALPAFGDAQQATGPPTVTLGERVWTQLALPGDVGELTLADLFGATLDPEAYGTGWVVYAYDPDSKGYVDPGVSGTLAPGRGFWMIQATGSDVVLSPPPSIVDARGELTASCSTGGACTAAELALDESAPSWHLWGAPSARAVPVADIVFTTAGADSACRDGCDLREAADGGLVAPRLWRFDSAVADYVGLEIGDDLGPWDGTWIATLPNPDIRSLWIEVPVASEPEGASPDPAAGPPPPGDAGAAGG